MELELEAMEEPIATRRPRRALKAVNYRQLENPKLPKSSVCATRDKLYPITVLEEDHSKVKIHYVGYSSAFDEWREQSELECLAEDEADSEVTTSTAEAVATVPYRPYSMYNALRMKIKQALNCGRRASPVINIIMPFDLIQFNGGLKSVGILSKKVHGTQHYQINHYRDLTPLLGGNWHYRGLNDRGDYGYVMLNTVDFCLRKARSFVEYHPPQTDETTLVKHCVDMGFSLSFSFVSNYGSYSTFGKDKNIFYE